MRFSGVFLTTWFFVVKFFFSLTADFVFPFSGLLSFVYEAVLYAGIVRTAIVAVLHMPLSQLVRTKTLKLSNEVLLDAKILAVFHFKLILLMYLYITISLFHFFFAAVEMNKKATGSNLWIFLEIEILTSKIVFQVFTFAANSVINRLFSPHHLKAENILLKDGVSSVTSLSNIYLHLTKTANCSIFLEWINF